jgi:serine-type D-Ala-D-Ala carboxypeptidase (penicillin-binding protein 5/6)
MDLNNLKTIFSIENRTKYFVHVFSFLLLLSIIVFSLLIVGSRALDKKKEVVEKKDPAIYFQNISLKGKGVVVYDIVSNKQIFSKNAEEPLPLASLTKVLTVIVASSRLSDDQKIKMAKEYLSAEGDSKFVVDDTWQVKDLRDFTLLTSSNDGALALASVAGGVANVPRPASSENPEAQFVREMNATATQIGLTNSKFFNEHGLDIVKDDPSAHQIAQCGAYGSAKDMAVLFSYALNHYPEILEATKYKNLKIASTNEIYTAENTNTFVDKIPNLIASKTGYTDLAGGNLVIVFDVGLNHPIIISILGSTQEGRFEDALKLVDATMNYINQI